MNKKINKRRGRKFVGGGQKSGMTGGGVLKVQAGGGSGGGRVRDAG